MEGKQDISGFTWLGHEVGFADLRTIRTRTAAEPPPLFQDMLFKTELLTFRAKTGVCFVESLPQNRPVAFYWFLLLVHAKSTSPTRLSLVQVLAHPAF